MKLVRRVVLLLLTAYLAATAVLFFFQDHLLFHPRHDYYTTPAAEQIPWEETWITTADKVRLHGWRVPALGESRGTILFFHGNGGNISSTIHAQEWFRVKGFDSLAMDYRGYGQSGGPSTPDESGLYRDADAIAAYAHNLDPDRRLIYWGYSLGGGVASYLAAAHPAAALVLQSTFTSVPDMAAALYPMFPARLLTRSQFPNRERLLGITSPLVVIHGNADHRIPEEQARTNFGAARGHKLFVEFDGGHEVEFFNHPASWDPIDRFLVASAGIAAQAVVSGEPPSPIVFALTRSDCPAGNCPSYRVRVRADGSVDYSGRLHVKTVGAAGAKLDPAEMAALRQAFLDAHFPSEERIGGPTATDAAFFRLSFMNEQGQIFLADRVDSPPDAPLVTLARRFDELTHDAQWIGP